MCTARGDGAFGSGLPWDQPAAPEGAGQVACYELTAVGKVKLNLLNKKWENSFLSFLRRGASGRLLVRGLSISCWLGRRDR